MIEDIQRHQQVLDEEQKRWNHECYFWFMFCAFAQWTLCERLKYHSSYGQADYGWGLLGQFGVIVFLFFVCSHASRFAEEVWYFRHFNKCEGEKSLGEPGRKRWQIYKCFWLTYLAIALWQLCSWSLEQRDQVWWQSFLGILSGVGLFFLLGRGRLYRCFTDIDDSFRLMQQFLHDEQERGSK